MGLAASTPFSFLSLTCIHRNHVQSGPALPTGQRRWEANKYVGSYQSCNSRLSFTSIPGIKSETGLHSSKLNWLCGAQLACHPL